MLLVKSEIRSSFFPSFIHIFFCFFFQVRDCFSIYAPICGNVFNNQVCNKATLKMQTLFYIYERLLFYLALAPPNDVENTFDQLSTLIRKQYGVVADRVLDYAEDNYLGIFHVNDPRVIPMPFIEFWRNIFHRTDEDFPRTNNSVEGWHRGFQFNVSTCHLTFWKFLEVLKKEETVVGVAIFQNQRGAPTLSLKKRHVSCNQRILKIVDDYPNRDRMNYNIHPSTRTLSGTDILFELANVRNIGS